MKHIISMSGGKDSTALTLLLTMLLSLRITSD